MKNAENEALGQIDSNLTKKSSARCFYNPSEKEEIKLKIKPNPASHVRLTCPPKPPLIYPSLSSWVTRNPET